MILWILTIDELNKLPSVPTFTRKEKVKPVSGRVAIWNWNTRWQRAGTSTNGNRWLTGCSIAGERQTGHNGANFQIMDICIKHVAIVIVRMLGRSFWCRLSFVRFTGYCRARFLPNKPEKERFFDLNHFRFVSLELKISFRINWLGKLNLVTFGVVPTSVLSIYVGI